MLPGARQRGLSEADSLVNASSPRSSNLNRTLKPWGQPPETHKADPTTLKSFTFTDTRMQCPKDSHNAPPWRPKKPSPQDSLIGSIVSPLQTLSIQWTTSPTVI